MIHRFIKGFFQGFRGECNNKQNSIEETIEVIDNSNINEQKVIIVPTTQMSKKQLLLGTNIELIEEVEVIEEDNIMQKNEEINLDKEIELIDLSKYEFLEFKGDYLLKKGKYYHYSLDIFFGIDLILFRDKYHKSYYYYIPIEVFINEIGIVKDKLLSWAKKCDDNNIKDFEKLILEKVDIRLGSRQYFFINNHIKNKVRCDFGGKWFYLTLSDINSICETIDDTYRHLILRKKYNEENKKKNFIDSLD